MLIITSGRNLRNASLLLNPVRLSDAGQYRVIVVSPTGSTESQASTLTVLAPATVVQQPVSKSVKPGVDISMDVVASGLLRTHR